MIEIPLIIIKGSFESRKRNYKCNICKKVIDRLFQYEDHWLGHLISGGGTLGDDSRGSGQPDARNNGDANGNEQHASSISRSNGMFNGLCILATLNVSADVFIQFCTKIFDCVLLEQG